MDKLRQSWLYGKTIILTGGARMGQAIAEALSEFRVNIVASQLSPRENADSFGVAVTADVSKPQDVARLAGEARRRFGRIDALVHLAASYERVPWHQLDEAAWRRSMEVIAKGAFLAAKIMGDEMLANEEGEYAKGKMVFVSDWATQRPYRDYLPYFMAKGAVETLVRSAAVELAPYILVNGIRPGPMIRPPDLSPEDDIRVRSRTPLGRWGGAEPIALAVRYLLEADFVTGSIMNVDGGRQLA